MAKCPVCKRGKIITVDSRQMDDMSRIYRVKICNKCGAQFKSLENMIKCKTSWKLPKKWITLIITRKSMNKLQ